MMQCTFCGFSRDNHTLFCHIRNLISDPSSSIDTRSQRAFSMTSSPTVGKKLYLDLGSHECRPLLQPNVHHT